MDAGADEHPESLTAVSTWRSTLAGRHWPHDIQTVRSRLSMLTMHSTITSSEMCRLASKFEGHHHLRSSDCSQLDVPRYRLATIDKRAFGYAGLKAWNSLPRLLEMQW